MKDKSISLEIKKIDSLIVRKIMACNKDSLCQLTPIQIVVIKYLIKNKNSIVYQKDIEKKLGLRKSTVSGILGTMIKNGIIIRTDSSNDLRSKEIRLTETGYKLDKAMKKRAIEFEKILQNNISKEELEIFYKVTKQIQKNLEGDKIC
ncbi:MAG: MarR family winged helix-turn-helix transcriptional regulator [Bacilli bacterium]